MNCTNNSIADFLAAARQNSSLNWYAIADSAQHRNLPNAIVEHGHQVRCLFDVPNNSPVARQAPHLAELDPPSENDKCWRWIERNGKSNPCISVIAANINFDALFSHLSQFVEVTLPDGDMMFFAFWDPAILGTLIGQWDDATLYIRGPVLTPEQRNALMSSISQWWYWDRGGVLHLINGTNLESSQKILPFVLSQLQVDNLVEASVPDHVLYYLLLNQPRLLADVEPSRRYGFTQKSLLRARDIGLSSMSDLVNFACLDFIYGNRMLQDECIIQLLDDVKKGKSNFGDVIGRFP